MAPKPAPIDTDAIERAIRFDASIFLGTGRFHTASFDNLKDARDAARQFAEVARNGRKGMVYAITPEGRSVFVPEHYQLKSNTSEGLIDMSTKTLSGTEIAKLTATITGGGFKRANSREAALKRFENVAAEKGFGDLAIKHTLKQPTFAEAQSYVQSVLREQRLTNNEEDRRGRELASAAVAGLSASRKAAIAARAPMEPKPLRDQIAEAKAKREAARPAMAERATGGKRAKVLAAAQAGTIPAAPDFTAETHKRFRPKLAEVVKLVEAGDIAGLEAFQINPVSSSPKAIAKFRDLAVIALKARAAAKQAA